MGIGGLNLGRLSAQHGTVAPAGGPVPKIVYIQVAGNDVDGIVPVNELAAGLVSFAMTLHQDGVQVVVLSMALHRTRPIHCSRRAYESRCLEFNIRMKELLIRPGSSRRPDDRALHAGIWLWEHQKLMVRPPLKDDIHLTEDTGLKRLYWSIRLALVEAAKHCSFRESNA